MPLAESCHLAHIVATADILLHCEALLLISSIGEECGVVVNISRHGLGVAFRSSLSSAKKHSINRRSKKFYAHLRMRSSREPQLGCFREQCALKLSWRGHHFGSPPAAGGHAMQM